MGQVQRSGDDVADATRADGGVSQGSPASDEDGEAAFSVPAQAAQQPVVGTVVDGEPAAVGGLFDRGLDAVTSAFVAGVGQGGQVEVRGGEVQRGGDTQRTGASHIV